MTKLSIKSARIVSRIQLILLFEIYMSFTYTKYMVGISKPACIQTCCNLQNQSNTDIYSIMCHIAKKQGDLNIIARWLCNHRAAVPSSTPKLRIYITGRRRKNTERHTAHTIVS